MKRCATNKEVPIRSAGFEDLGFEEWQSQGEPAQADGAVSVDIEMNGRGSGEHASMK